MKKVIMIAVFTVAFVSCKNTDTKGVVLDDVHQTTIDSMKSVAEKQHIIDSMTMINNSQKPKEVVVVHDQQATAATPKRKKWSRAAKGAVIGAGVGAITGALVDKKHGEGAIIGGLAGAGLGAGTGAIIDDSKRN
ncbi:glycine zipper family protein [Flavobacterium sp. N1994]|uniref:glycine zipper family protein n=1 Tax=Flavobacterium sp. N1994 TaxID=2986827 RepID=UPI002223DB85|nr:glycine zipper family protein [Flavobacterium sp. N1994]